MSEHPLPIIVGIDPGTTTALAILDTEGNLLSVMSRKGLTRAALSRHISRFGRPVIVAADRRPAPAAVERISATYSARLVVPGEDLSRREKNLLAKEMTREGSPEKLNQHEKDAMASAVYAFNSIKPTMKRVDQRIRSLGHGGNEDLSRFVRTRVILFRDHVKRGIEKYLESGQ